MDKWDWVSVFCAVIFTVCFMWWFHEDSMHDEVVQFDIRKSAPLNSPNGI